jgi:hypothetical protein
VKFSVPYSTQGHSQTNRCIFRFADYGIHAVLDEPEAPDVSDFTMSLNFDDLFHCKVGSALITYRDQAWYSPIPESPVHTLELMEAPFCPCMIFSEDSSHEHSTKSVHTQGGMLVDSGFTITIMGINSELSAYIQPSTSGVKMRSATGQVVQPACEGNITLQAYKAPLVLTCQYTPAIG